MKITKLLPEMLLVVWIMTLLSGCGGGMQLSAPAEVKEAIETNTPSSEYGYYVLEGTDLQQVAELADKTLLVCGDAPSDAAALVAASAIDSLGKPLFRASKQYFINPNIDCQGFGPCALTSQTLRFKSIPDEFTQESYAYKSRTDPERLLLSCINALHEDSDLFLLIKRDALSHQKGAVTEIEFK